jgi:hypothetical protein
MTHIPHQPIEDKSLHAHYAKLVEKLSLILVRARKVGAKDRLSRLAIVGLAQYVKLIAELVEHYEKEQYPVLSATSGVVLNTFTIHRTIARTSPRVFA